MRARVSAAKMWPVQLCLIGFAVSTSRAESCTSSNTSHLNCKLKDNAESLLSVGFALEGNETAVDEIWVRMKNKARFANLLEDGCDHSGTIVTVSFKGDEDKDWLGGLRKNVKQHREFQIKNLNPCRKYKVKVKVGEIDLPLFEVGPFYEEEQTFAYLENSEDNEEFIEQNREAARHVKVSDIKDTTATVKVTPRNFCARSIGISVQREEEKKEGECEEEMKMVHRDPSSSSSVSSGLRGVTFDNLLPCTSYELMLDMFLNKHEAKSEMESSLHQPSVASFKTLPTTDNLKKSELVRFNTTSKTFSWDFASFFEQPCAAGSLEFSEVQLKWGEGTENFGLKDSVMFIEDCEHEVNLLVNFKEGGQNKSVVALSQKVPRTSDPPMEEVFVDENDMLQMTRDPCFSVPSIKLVPKNKDLAPKEISIHKFPMETSKISWEGCLDYEVQATRPSEIDPSWPTLRHPGWKNLLVGWNLQVASVNESSITFEPLEKPCDVTGIKLEIQCDSVIPVEKAFGPDEMSKPLVLDENVTPGAKFKCKARMIKEGEEKNNTNTGPWTEVTEVTTDEEEVKLHPMSVAGPDNEERSNKAEEEEAVEENAKRAQEDASIAPTLIGVGCIVVIVALAVVVVWKGMVGKKVEPSPLVVDGSDLDGDLAEVLVSSEEELHDDNVKREPGSRPGDQNKNISGPTKSPSDSIKDQNGSIVGALEQSAPQSHVDAREA